MKRIEETFIGSYKVLFNDIENAWAKYKILVYLSSLGKDKIKVLNISNFFWGEVIDALNTDVIISTARIFDVDKNFKPRSDINIVTFLNFITNNFYTLYGKENVWSRNGISSDKDWRSESIPLLKSEEVKNDFRRLESNKEKILILMFYRDKSYAHTDKDFITDKENILKEKVIKNSEIGELIKIAYEILKKYRLSFDGSIYAFPAANLNDAEKTVDILFNYLTEKEKERDYNLRNLTSQITEENRHKEIGPE